MLTGIYSGASALDNYTQQQEVRLPAAVAIV